MDIETLGSWGEFLGGIASIAAAVGVIASLVFVGIQIKRSTAESQSENASHFVRRHFELVAPIALDPIFAANWARAGESFDEMTEGEQLQFINYEWRAISSWNHDFHLRQLGLIADHQWHEVEWLIEFVGQRESTRRAWQVFRSAYLSEFQSFMDQKLALSRVD